MASRAAQPRSVVSLCRLLVPLLFASCLEIAPSESADAGSGDARSKDDAPEAAAAAAGSNCRHDPVSGVVLCMGIGLCPGLAVDPDLYPDCGFRAPSSSIDIECVCGDLLCPVGTALDCVQAQELLALQSEISTCTQSSEGRCAPRSAVKPGNGCDGSCAGDCAGDPTCLALCGC